MVEEAALQLAEEECLKDEDARFRRQVRGAERRAEYDQEYIKRFALRIRKLFPSCPAGREQIIAEHACQKHSGRAGCTAGAKTLEEKSITLAVIAHIRHFETNYDQFLSDGIDRFEARKTIEAKIQSVLTAWRS
ncbi:MAG: DUF2293 domain-containing protein [Chloroflexota bacterium]